MPGDHNRSEPGDPPTERQADVLLMIRLLTAWRGVAPTVRDLKDALLMHHNAVWDHLRLLRRKGLVTWERGRARTLRALSPPAAAGEGATAPGAPTPAG